MNDVARYTKNVDIDCDFFGDCELDKIRVCSEIENETGYLFDDPNTLDDRHVELFHSTDRAGETPTLDVVMFSPSPSDVKPQGFVTASGDREGAQRLAVGRLGGSEQGLPGGQDRRLVRVRDRGAGPGRARLRPHRRLEAGLPASGARLMLLSAAAFAG